MVEVFKTNIEDESIADSLAVEIQALFPGSTVNFDLEDCDRILRVAGPAILPARVAAVLQRSGHRCEILV